MSYSIGDVVRIKDTGWTGVVEQETMWGGGIQILSIRVLSGGLYSRDDSEVEPAKVENANEFVSDVKILAANGDTRLATAAALLADRPAPLSAMVITPERLVSCAVCGQRWETILASLDHGHFATADE